MDFGPRKFDVLGFSCAEIEKKAKELLPSGFGVARALYRRAFFEGVFEPESHGLVARSAEAWRRHFCLSLPEVVETICEPTDDGRETVKAILRLQDGLTVESVRIPMGVDHYTLCVSSQVGCKLACQFCETGKMGLLRNLSTAEIVGQLVVARTRLAWDIRNIVFMGMGEPLDNVENVTRALRIFNDRFGLNYGQQRLTVCTAGKVEGLKELAELGFKRMDISISLNSADDEARNELMPINRKTALKELQKALIAYPRRRNFAFGINYCLMPGLNDSREDARKVAEFCKPIGRVMLNLIPYNPGSKPITRAPEEEEIERFIAWLSEEGLPVKRRVTKGRGVMGACGQLGDVGLRKKFPRSERSWFA